MESGARRPLNFCAYHSDVVSDLVGKDTFHLLFCWASRLCDLFFIARAKMKMQVRIEQIERNKIEEISREKVRFT